GPELPSLFGSPSVAVASVLGDRSRAELAELCKVELRDAGTGPENRRDRTVVFRDCGIGMGPADLPRAFFRVGSSNKDGVLWQMGAFGRGGLTVLPNCCGAVVVSRRCPDLLSSASEDLITVTAVRWERVGNRQTETALYLVTSPWRTDGDEALPFSVSAEFVPDFPPGTYVGVVAFHADGIWVSRLGDERSLDTLLDTRLFEPPLPASLTTPALDGRDARVTVLRGLGHRLADNPRRERSEGREVLPFGLLGTT